jgi:hypothetical protein
MQYRYYQGVYYQPVNGGYQVVPAPLNSTIMIMPTGYSTVAVAGTNYYYFGGVFYIYTGGAFMVVTAPPGAVVYHLPGGCEPVQYGNITYMRYNNTFFQPIFYNGQNAYEVVEVQ